MKYDIPNNQAEVLSNILGLTTVNEIALSEFEGFLQAEIMLTEDLTARTRFNTKYILKIHKLALGHLYSFAGKLRDVNLSKGNFPFASAQYLSQTMQYFEDDILFKLPNKYDSREELIRDISIVHAELLLIHPFREGNGRTARILANLMSRKGGYGPLNFEKIDDKEFEKYVSAIQQAGGKDYSKMIKFIRSIFPV
ncbi:MAG: Fic family protein [Saprospiraceae bacterium]